jgi:hypothetical protein
MNIDYRNYRRAISISANEQKKIFKEEAQSKKQRQAAVLKANQEKHKLQKQIALNDTDTDTDTGTDTDSNETEQQLPQKRIRHQTYNECFIWEDCSKKSKKSNAKKDTQHNIPSSRTAEDVVQRDEVIHYNLCLFHFVSPCTYTLSPLSTAHQRHPRRR